MSLIFISFPDMQKARAFREHVKQCYGLEGQVFATADETHEHVMFPRVQEPPVVHIDRVWCESDAEMAAVKQRFGLSDEEVKEREDEYCGPYTMTNVIAEKRVVAMVGGFGGVFVGT